MTRLLTTLGAVLALLLLPGAPAGAQERVVLAQGHVDVIAPVLEDGAVTIKTKDDTGEAPVFRDPADVLLHVKPQARQELPDGLPPAYAFLGRPGDPVWILPQNQDQELVWPGWSSEAIARGALEGDQLTWSLNGVDGPGPVQLYSVGGTGQPDVVFDTNDDQPDEEVMPVGAHAHYNWVFHAEGVHDVRFSVAARSADGERESTSFATLRFFVGELDDLPPDAVYFSGLNGDLDAGETVTLSAHQVPATAFSDYRWTKRCGAAEPVTIGTGTTLELTGDLGDDGCRIGLALLDGPGGEVVKTADEQAVYVRTPDWGPRRVLSRGHVDALHVELVDGKLAVDVKDDGVEPTAFRRIDQVLLHGKPASEVQIPEDPEWAFLGPGATTFLLPEVQQEDLVWPGYDTAGVPAGEIEGGALTWRMLSVEGPGKVAVFGTSLFGGPAPMFDSGDGLPDATRMGAETHSHMNWAFSRPGLYKVRFAIDGQLTDDRGKVESGPLEFWFFLGDAKDLPAYPTPPAGGEPTATTPTTTTPSPAAPAPPAPAPDGTPAPPVGGQAQGGQPPAEPPAARAVTRLGAAAGSARRLLRRGGFPVACGMSIAGTCSVRATVSAADARRLGVRARSRVTIANGAARLPRGDRRNVRVALTRQGRTVLRKLRRSSRAVTVELTTRSRFAATGAVSTDTTRLRVGR